MALARGISVLHGCSGCLIDEEEARGSSEGETDCVASSIISLADTLTADANTLAHGEKSLPSPHVNSIQASHSLL